MTIDRGQWVSEVAGLIDQVMGNMCAGGGAFIESPAPPRLHKCTHLPLFCRHLFLLLPALLAPSVCRNAI